MITSMPFETGAEDARAAVPAHGEALTTGRLHHLTLSTGIESGIVEGVLSRRRVAFRSLLF